MNYEYQYIENNSSIRGYNGILYDKKEATTIFKNDIKKILIDKEQRERMLSVLKSLEQDTGFAKSETLLLDIQSLYNENVEVQDFRIGEALAEFSLEKYFNCRFYWNELRDTRNPKGNKTGADLVGFIEVDSEVLFLFGEVKTSSEQKSPPQVMTNPNGLESQLRQLYNDQQKKLILISYIQSKMDLNNKTKLKEDFNKAVINYYKQNNTYLLYGVLVRDTEPAENDVKKSYENLITKILEPVGLQLLAIYLPIPKSQWLNIINGE